jgi:hypothetical protein
MPAYSGFEMYGLGSDFIFGNNTNGDTAGGPIDMSAATSGEYVFGEGGKWHQRVSTNAYSWFIIVGALVILFLMGGLVFGDVNV